MARLIVIGAGAMGLAAGLRAAQQGHSVLVLEAASEPGGMAGHFDLNGLSLERFYHFVTKTDEPTVAMLRELGLEDKLRWRDTTMGIFIHGELFDWGDPVALLRFPHLSFIRKLRYAVFAFACVRRNVWPALESKSAKDWITSWCGQTVYDTLWDPLFRLKFYEDAGNISASWIWTRIRRIGRSRRNLMQEQLGYLEGGTLTLVNSLIEHLTQHGGRVKVSTPVTRVAVVDGQVVGVHTPSGFFSADCVISTVPTPYVPKLVPALSTDWKLRYESIRNIGCICVVLQLSRMVSPHFWVNISDPDIEVPGIIEFSNLRSFGEHRIVYVPYYMPVTNRRFSWTDEQLVDDALACLQKINPMIRAEHVLAAKVSRLQHAQPVCEPGFMSKIPPVQTPIRGLQVADTSFYYPEDRGIAESLRLGLAMATSLGVVENVQHSQLQVVGGSADGNLDDAISAVA